MFERRPARVTWLAVGWTLRPFPFRVAPESIRRPDHARAHMQGMVMADQRKLSFVLGEFARTVITDFPIQGILDHLVKSIVGVLPIDAAGVTLISANRKPEYIVRPMHRRCSSSSCNPSWVRGPASQHTRPARRSPSPTWRPTNGSRCFRRPRRRPVSQRCSRSPCDTATIPLVRSTCTEPALARSMRTIWKRHKPWPM